MGTSVHHLSTSVAAVELGEKLTTDETQSLTSTVHQLLAGGVRTLLLDVRTVRNVDVAGLRVLLTTMVQCTRKGGQLLLANPSQELEQALAKSGNLRLLQGDPDLPDEVTGSGDGAGPGSWGPLKELRAPAHRVRPGQG